MEPIILIECLYVQSIFGDLSFSGDFRFIILTHEKERFVVRRFVNFFVGIFFFIFFFWLDVLSFLSVLWSEWWRHFIWPDRNLIERLASFFVLRFCGVGFFFCLFDSLCNSICSIYTFSFQLRKNYLACLFDIINMLNTLNRLVFVFSHRETRSTCVSGDDEWMRMDDEKSSSRKMP